MQYLERVSSFIDKNNVDLTKLRHAVRSSVLNLVIMEYCKNMKKIKTPIPKIEVPELKSVSHLLNRDSEFIEKLSTSLMKGIYESNIRNSYLDDVEIFNYRNLELLNGFFDAVIVNDLQSIIGMIKDRFLHPDSEFKEKIGSSILSPIKEEHISFVIEESAISIATRIKDIIHIPERNDLVTSESSIIEIKSPFTGIPIYLNMNIMDNPIVMDSISFVYQFSYNKLMNSYVMHFDKPNEYTSIIEIKK